MKLYASEFAQRNGYPLNTIKRLCKTGKLPYIAIGRKYLMDEEECNLTMQRLKEHPLNLNYVSSSDPVVRSQSPSRRSRYMHILEGSTKSFVGQLDDLIRK